jgi:hypothetical protein
MQIRALFPASEWLISNVGGAGREPLQRVLRVKQHSAFALLSRERQSSLVIGKDIVIHKCYKNVNLYSFL